jgi:hypothetical protein
MESHVIIPPEIWRTIFRFATEVRGILDISPLPPLNNELRLHIESPSAQTQYEMATKRTLVRVCKLWGNLAIEYLYEFIWLWYPRELLSLINTLKLHSHDDTALGWHVKSIWLSIGVLWRNSTTVDDAMRSLFNSCHDIKVLRIWPDSTFQTDFPVIADRAPSIRIVEMHWNHCPQFRSFCLPLLLQLHKFEHLEALAITFFLGTYEFPDIPLTFPRVRTLKIRSDSKESSDIILGILTQWSMPLLCFILLELQTRGAAILESFLHSHGQNVHTIIFGRGVLVPLSASAGKHLPSMQDISIQYSQINSPVVALFTTPHLQRIQVSATLPLIYMRTELSCFMDALNRLIFANASSLKIIQLSNMVASTIQLEIFAEDAGQLREWSEDLLRRGVRVEDRFGTLI